MDCDEILSLILAMCIERVAFPLRLDVTRRPIEANRAYFRTLKSLRLVCRRWQELVFGIQRHFYDQIPPNARCVLSLFTSRNVPPTVDTLYMTVSNRERSAVSCRRLFLVYNGNEHPGAPDGSENASTLYFKSIYFVPTVMRATHLTLVSCWLDHAFVVRFPNLCTLCAKITRGFTNELRFTCLTKLYTEDVLCLPVFDLFPSLKTAKLVRSTFYFERLFLADWGQVEFLHMECCINAYVVCPAINPILAPALHAFRFVGYKPPTVSDYDVRVRGVDDCVVCGDSEMEYVELTDDMFYA